MVLRFDAATHRATVWVDDTEVMSHEGGYTPFEADVTALVSPGLAIRVTVVVDNELTWASIPPGEVLTTPAGRRQKYGHDFFNHAGLARSPWLVSTPHDHLQDLVVTTDLDGPTGIVHYDVAASTDELDDDARRCATRRHRRRDRGRHVGLARASRTCTLGAGDGYLYELTVSLMRRATRWSTPTASRSGSAPSRSAASELLVNGRALSTSVGSASTRSRPSAARATTTCRWSTTSS